MVHSTYRPNGHQGQGDSHLPQIAQQLQQVLSTTQADFVYDTLRLDDDALGELAEILVDFAEDLHNGVGIWETYERYNVEFFGTALGGGPYGLSTAAKHCWPNMLFAAWHVHGNRPIGDIRRQEDMPSDTTLDMERGLFRNRLLRWRRLLTSGLATTLEEMPRKYSGQHDYRRVLRQ